ncbi:NADP-dependent malic enzyme [Bartonella sp. DGB1]|uniref:NADP-dependent malic enzyme n=1 Tax=Bartonella sp. DGB1 TaxID=3239807 RepID=UPI003523DFC8
MNKKNDQKNLSPLEEAALFFHQHPTPGKLEITPTKPLGNQRDMALAYSPGVATPCLAIYNNPKDAYKYTTRGNLIAVVSNGSAVLGLGNIGPLASKPVMEGKAVLFKKFANIDVFDIEIDAPDVQSMVSTISALEPTFGGINLEDIKAPECFEVESLLRKKLKIPVFHDDQHGTAIIVAAAVLNSLKLSGKKLEDIKIVGSGAGAAALACLNLLVSLGAKKSNIWITDIGGVVTTNRVDLDPWKAAYAQDSTARTLADIIDNADVFLGLSAGGVLKAELLPKMANMPLILALANPTPEIMPEEARAVRPDAIICTGRSDYPNQVNNVLCFPFIFRGALDVEATEINEAMKIAAVEAIAKIASEESSDIFAQSYGFEDKVFGSEYLIPVPFDPRLILRIAPAVAKAAMDTGVAMRPIENFDIYIEKLQRFLSKSGLVLKPLLTSAKLSDSKRVIYADGEDQRILRATQAVIDENIAIPTLIGRPQVIENRINRLGLRIRPYIDFDIINPEDDPRYKDYVTLLLKLVGRKGVTPEAARVLTRTSTTVIAALAVMRGEADSMVCGLSGRFERHLEYIKDIVGLKDGVDTLAALSLLITPHNTLFLTDTQVNLDPQKKTLVEITSLAIEEVKKFGITPRIALLSHSDFGSKNSDSALKMRYARDELNDLFPDLEIDGEMQGHTALSSQLRARILPESKLIGDANLLIFPNLDAANITFSVLKSVTNAVHVGPIILGTAKPVHILTPSVTVHDIVNISALLSVKTM